MLKKLVLSSILVLVHTPLLALTPDGEVSITNIKSSGPGCPPGTVNAFLNFDGDQFFLLYNQFELHVNGDVFSERFAYSYCTITFDLEVPDGWSYSLVDMEIAGNADLDRGVYANITSYFKNTGLLGFSFPASTSLRGPLTGPFTQQVKNKVSKWSGCSSRITPISVTTTASLSTYYYGRTGDLYFTDASGEISQIFNLKWRHCDASPPPPPPSFNLLSILLALFF